MNKLFAKAFAEWERRYREEPERFMTEFQRQSLATDSYGESCAKYFEQIIVELA